MFTNAKRFGLGVALSAALVFATATQVGAVVLETAAGAVLLDQIGDQGRSLIRDLQATGDALIATAGEEAVKRGKQLLDYAQNLLNETANELLTKTGQEADRVIAGAIAKLSAERSAAIKDLADTLSAAINEAQCAVSRVTGQDLVSLFPSIFGSGSIRLEAQYPVDDPLWNDDRLWILRIALPRKIQIHVVDYAANRNKMYDEVVAVMSVFVSDAAVKPTTDARDIVATWEYLSAASYSFACHFQGNADRYVENYLLYKAKADLWKRYLPLAPIGQTG